MDFNLIIPALLENWPLFFVAAIFWLFGDQIKKYAPTAEDSKFWKFFRMTLPLHPVIAGVILGCFSFMPLPATINALGGAVGSLYYAGAGFLSIYFQDLTRTFFKYLKNKM